MNNKTRRFAYGVIIWEVVSILIMLAVLYQPMVGITEQGHVDRHLPFNTLILDTDQGMHIYPLVPVYRQAGRHSEVSLTCNRGIWIPVLLDCEVTVYIPSPGNLSIVY